MTQQLFAGDAMTAPVAEPPMLSLAIRRELLRLADLEDATAAQEASAVPYWAPCPSTVLGHRRAAVALRAEADRLSCQASMEGAGA